MSELKPTTPCPECGAHYIGNNVFDCGKGGLLGEPCKTCEQRFIGKMRERGRQDAERLNNSVWKAVFGSNSSHNT